MITSFYNSVYPQGGLRVLAVFKNGLKNAPTHQFFDNNEDLIEAANTYNSLKKNVYHGCAVYSTPDNRKATNAAASKCLWIDLDVGENKPYKSQKEAAAHFEQFRTALGLPKSHVVSSGGGIHEYIAFTKPITAEQWQRLAPLLAACLDHFGVKHDTSRTTDIASILRIPGTHNYKTDPAKDVTLKRLGEEAAASEIFKALNDYAKANGLFAAPATAKGKTKQTNKLIGVRDFPPSDGSLIADKCAVIQEVSSTGGDVGYEVWWRAMGVAKFTVTPEETAEHWTRNRAATGHEKADYIKIMDEWSAGPTMCENFAKHSDKCKGCKFNGKGLSPIMLGAVEPELKPIELPADGADAEKPDIPEDRQWTFGAEWLRKELGKKVGAIMNEDCMLAKVWDEAVDGYVYVRFCDRYWQVMRRVCGPDGVWQLEIAFQTYVKGGYDTFLIDSATVTSPDLLRKEFSTRELHLHGVKGAVQKAQQIIIESQRMLYTYKEHTATLPTMGWQFADGSLRGEPTGEFVLGNRVYAPKQPPREVLLADTVDPALRQEFHVKGTTQEWVDLIDHIYNRPGAEAYQFVIASAFASPLVRLVPGGGEWHGIPIAIGGDSGSAKTSTALAAMSIYTPGQALRFSAQGDKGGQGDTINALSLKVGALRSIPCLMDEMTGADATKVGEILFMLSNGRSKDRMGPDGKMIRNPFRWDMTSIITSNDDLHEVLEGAKTAFATEAGQLRCFKVFLSRNDLKTVFHNVNKTTVEDSLLAEQYGMVGRDWIQFVVNNRERIAKVLGDQRRNYVLDPNESSDIRFFKDLVITIKVAASLAKGKGFIKWDVDKMVAWAEKQILSMRDSIGAKDADSQISDFVASLHPRTIVTKRFQEGRGRRHDLEAPINQIPSGVIPVARQALDAHRFFFAASYLKEWCSPRRIQPSNMLNAMVDRGYLKAETVGDGSRRAVLLAMNIGSGSTITRPRAPCYEFDYAAMVPIIEALPPETSNVVQLPTAPAVTETVTEPQKDEGAALATP